MPVKRRAAKIRDHRITPEAIEAFRAGDQGTLDRLLGLKPWEASPLASNNPYPHGTAYSLSWPQSRDLLEQLEAAK